MSGWFTGPRFFSDSDEVGVKWACENATVANQFGPKDWRCRRYSSFRDCAKYTHTSDVHLESPSIWGLIGLVCRTVNASF